MFRALGNGKASMRIDIFRRPHTIRQLVERLRNAQVAHPVHVDGRRDIDAESFERVGRVIDDIQVSREAKTLTVHRYKSQVYTRCIFNNHRIHNIVVVEAHGQRR